MDPVCGNKVGVAGVPPQQTTQSCRRVCDACTLWHCTRRPGNPYHSVHGEVQMHASCQGWRGSANRECPTGAPHFSFLETDSHSPPTTCTSSTGGSICTYLGALISTSSKYIDFLCASNRCIFIDPQQYLRIPTPGNVQGQFGWGLE